MTSKDAIRNTLDMSENIIDAYLADLSDADLLLRPVNGMNNMAWQIGHLIGAERHFIEILAPGSSPPLPANFEGEHGKASVNESDPSKFCSLAKYKELWKAQRAATCSVLEKMSDADLDRTGPEFPPFANTTGKLLNMCGIHALMHAGQFVAVRRSLGKPISI